LSSYLRIRNLYKNFGDFTALKDISLDIEEGEFVCFLGPSGCGKTTLLRAIAGLDLQSHGSVEQAGRDISDLPVTRRDFGIVFQSYALFPNLTIERNIAFGLENLGKSKAEVGARVTEPWPAPSPPPPACCCSMSPCLPWTPRCACTCATRSRNFRGNWASPPSW
jgi:iron(III) transport system ATP-binding protein